MGFSVIASFAVVGVSILIAIEIFSGNLFPALTSYDDSYDELIDRSIDYVQTDINITNVTTSSFGDNYNHSILVKNTGSITLNCSSFTILINGTTMDFNYSKSYLYPEKNAYFNISNLPGEEDKRLKVISDNGNSDYHEYVI